MKKILKVVSLSVISSLTIFQDSTLAGSLNFGPVPNLNGNRATGTFTDSPYSATLTFNQPSSIDDDFNNGSWGRTSLEWWSFEITKIDEDEPGDNPFFTEPASVEIEGYLQHNKGPHGEGIGPRLKFRFFAFPNPSTTSCESKDHGSHRDVNISCSLTTNVGSLIGGRDYYITSYSFTVSAKHTPEPTTLLGLLAFGGIGLLSSKKRIK